MDRSKIVGLKDRQSNEAVLAKHGYMYVYIYVCIHVHTCLCIAFLALFVVITILVIVIAKLLKKQLHEYASMCIF